MYMRLASESIIQFRFAFWKYIHALGSVLSIVNLFGHGTI